MRRIRRVLLMCLCLLMASVASRAQINTDRMMMVGRNALYFEDYVLSIQYFNQVINAKPYLSDPYFYRAVAKLSLEDFPGAENDCGRAISINPYVVNSYQVRGLARVYQQKYRLAIEDYLTALKWDPESASIRHNLILCYMQEDMTDEAMLQIDTLLAQNPRYTAGMSMRSHILIERNDTAGALALLDSAIVIDKYEPGLLRDRAVIYASAGNYDKAEEDIDMALNYSPDDAGFHIDRALVRFYKNNLRGAMEDYDIALDIDPSNINGHYNRGVLRAQVGDDNRAITDFDIVIEAQPDNMMAVFNRGLLRDQTGDISGAVQDYTAVLAEYPEFIYGYELRAAARYKLGDKKGAEQDELVVMRDRTSHFGSSNQNNGKKDKDSDNKDNAGNDNSEKTRKESDNDVWNYKKIVVADKDAVEFSSEYRGKVQNRNVDVRLLASYIFTWSGLDKVSEIDREVKFSTEIESLNSNGKLPFRLLITNVEQPLSQSQINALFRDVDNQTAVIGQDPDNPAGYFARAVDFFLLQDFANAQNDFTQAILAGGDYLWAAYFGRAMVRMRMSEIQIADNQLNNSQSGKSSESKSSSGSQYQLVFNDLSKTIDLAPGFAYAYYNRANLEASTGDYRSALADYNQAITINDRFAEAYYNRGLALVFLNRIREGLADFGVAGELGIYHAYNVMKRFSN